MSTQIIILIILEHVPAATLPQTVLASDEATIHVLKYKISNNKRMCYVPESTRKS